MTARLDPSRNAIGAFQPVVLSNGARAYLLPGTNLVLTLSDLRQLGLLSAEDDVDSGDDEQHVTLESLLMTEEEEREERGAVGEAAEAAAAAAAAPDQREIRTRRADRAALEEFGQIVRLASAAAGPQNVQAMLRRREVNHRAMSSSTKAALMKRFIPSTRLQTMHYEGRAFCGRFSPDGDVFCSASQDGMIHLFSTDTWEKVRQIEARDVGWSVVDIDLSPDKRFVIYSSWSDCVHLCNVGGDYELHKALDFHPIGQSCMFGVRFAPDNQEILAGCNQGMLFLYDVERERRTCGLQAHNDDINTVAYADSAGNIFATGSDDGLVKVWDRRTIKSALKPDAHTPTEHARSAIHSSVGGFSGHQLGITCVASKGDGRYILSNSKDQSMKLWDLRMLRPTDEILDHARRLSSANVHFDYRWRRFQRSGARLRADNSLMTYLGHSVQQTLIRCNFSPGASTGHQFVYSGSGDGRVYVYDAVSGELVRRIGHHSSLLREASWHPHLPVIATSSWDGTTHRLEYRQEDLAGGDNSDDSSDDEPHLGWRSRRRRRSRHRLNHSALLPDSDGDDSDYVPSDDDG